MGEAEERARKADEVLTRFWRQVEDGHPIGVEDLLAQNESLRDVLEPRVAAYRRMQSDLGKVAVGGEDETPPLEKVIDKLREQGDSSARYELRGEIARGGMGAVLRVWDSRLRRSSAMKVILGDDDESTGKTADVDSQTLGRFLEEAQVTAQLDHPGVVPVHELGLDSKGRVYFTMRLVKGSDLQQVFDRVSQGEEGWTQTRALGVLLKVCEAMAYAHSKGVIHRDLKPANIMVGRFGEVYVMDWGLAKVLGAKDVHDLRWKCESEASASAIRTARGEEADKDPNTPLVTMDGTIMGTPAYMSPEQARGDIEALGPRSDVYSVGAMIYHLLAGAAPFVPAGARLNNYAVWLRVQEGPPRPLTEVAPRAPPELVAICEKAIARDNEDRYQTTLDLAEDLRAFLERRVVGAFESGPWAEARKWVQRNRGTALSLAAASVVALSGFGIAGFIQISAKQSALRQRDLLLAQQDLADVLADVDELWPVEPARIGDFRSWISRAESFQRKAVGYRKRLEETYRGGTVRQSFELESRKALRSLQASIAAKRHALEFRENGRPVELLRDVDWAAIEAKWSPRGRVAALHLEEALAALESDDVRRALPVALRAAESVQDDSEAKQLRVGAVVSRAFFALGRDDEALEWAEFDRRLMSGEPEERSFLERLERAIASATSPEGLEAARENLAWLERSAELLQMRIDGSVTCTFPDDEREARWWSEHLRRAISGAEVLSDPFSGLLQERAATPEYGPSVVRRLAWAERLAADFGPGGVLERRWQQSLPAIQSAYSGLTLESQLGLVPLGPDPESGLWEFWHVLSGGEPQRNSRTGAVELDEASGMVLVLIPRGAFWMGTQTVDPIGRNFSHVVGRGESPLHEETVEPFFLSKFEMTEAQWARLSGRRQPVVEGPSLAPPYPAASVSWDECGTWLPRYGLRLPTEEEWEYACRAGTETPWWTGADPLELVAMGAANLNRDSEESMGILAMSDPLANLDGRIPSSRPVCSGAPNPFGLHDVHGNVQEWCEDAYAEDAYAQKSIPLDRRKVVHVTDAARVVRGGSSASLPRDARSATRLPTSPFTASSLIGVRPARDIKP